jgi:hypothetical protein
VVTYRDRQWGLLQVAMEELKALAEKGLEKDQWERGILGSVTSHRLSCFGSFEFLANQIRFHG